MGFEILLKLRAEDASFSDWRRVALQLAQQTKCQLLDGKIHCRVGIGKVGHDLAILIAEADDPTPSSRQA